MVVYIKVAVMFCLWQAWKEERHNGNKGGQKC